MTQFLPPNLLALFAPRDAPPFLPPTDKLPHEKKTRGYQGVGSFLGFFEDPKDTPPPTRVETKEERIERRRREKAEQVAYKLEREIAMWDPNKLKDTTEDPFKTLFVARINYDTSESKLRREFEVYGPIKKILMVQNADSAKPRGYAFIEYEHERDMHSAYKHGDGKKIDGKRVLVDVERARTVKGWLSRRLGGGLGGTRRGGPEVNIKHSGREDNERERERYRIERENESRSDRRPDRGDRSSAGGAPDRFERRRSRSRDRPERRRERSRSRDKERRNRKDKSRDRSERDKREKDRKRRRSRSKDRSEKKRDRKDKDREERRKDRGDKERKPEMEIKIKEEPVDDYPDYTSQFPDPFAVKYEDEEDEKDVKSEDGSNNGFEY